jgi:DNA-binding transcriptional MerR regulator
VALLERLQILIDADAKGAVREFGKAGQAADRLDAKLEKGAAKTSAKLTSIGTKAVIGGTIVLGGLFKLAQASEEAEIQQVKLDNSIKNSDNSFKNGGKALRDLADDLQKVTAADGDAIVGAESLLIQFGLTEEQVKNITPLVVDLSRKLGIDLDTAAKMVGKSVGGSAGALKKAGIEVDATRIKTDAYSATVDALAGSVGGFAKNEGKTFAGQIEILKNNLGDLGESVGKGAAGVFGDLAEGANGFIGALNDINPAIGDSVGRIGAIGGIAVTAVGGLAVVVGQFDKVKTAAFNAEGGLTGFGKAAGAIGFAAGAFALYEIGQAIKDAQVNSVEFQKTVGNLADAKGPQELGKAFRDAEQDSKTFLDELARFVDPLGKSDNPFLTGRVAVEGYDVSLSDVDRTLASLSKSGNISALSNAIAVLETNTKGSKQELKDLAQVVKPYKEQVRDSAGATAQATVAQREQTKAVQDSVDAYDSENATLEGIQKTFGEYEKKIRSLDDAYEAAQTGAKAFGDAIERSTELDNLASAAVNVSERLRTITADLSALPKSFQDAFDPAKITEGSGKAIESLLVIGDAVTKQFQTLIVSGNEQLIPGLAAQYRDTITKALKAAGIPPDQIKQYLGLAGLNDEQIQVALKVTQVEEELAKFKQRLAILQTDLSNAPQEVRVAIDQALLAGDVAEANRQLNSLVGTRTATIYAEIVARGGTIAGVPVPGLVESAPKPAKKPRRRRALGGPLARGQMSMVNEMGAEMFVPSSSGFVMDSDDSKALVRGVKAMLAGGGNTFNITTTEPRAVATEVVRKQRDAAYLIGR